MFTIKRAAEQVGISAATLRAWERRYAIVAPRRSGGGYRIYDEADVRALTLMARLVEDGWTPSLAAGEVRHRLQAMPTEESGAQPSSSREASDAFADRRPVHRPLDQDGGADTDAGAGSSRRLTEAVIAAAAALDVPKLAAALDEMFALGSYEAVVDRHLLPAMEALGEAWATGRVSVAGEHLASHAVLRRLAAAFEAAAPYGGGPRVLVGLPPGARHEVGLLAFAVGARRRGLLVDYLGSDLPVEDWVGAVTKRHPAAVVLAVPTAADIEAAGGVVTALRASHPGVVVAVGGREQDHAPLAATRLGHRVGAAARTLTELLNPPVDDEATRTSRRA
jgi:DNA-binding transcriptional MerR regulator/methylmalonyl-CoA mutase cobalamin-binding subunit